MARSYFSTAGLVISLMIAMALPAWAVPGLVNFQGKLTDSGGNSLNGSFSMTFRLYLVESDGSSIWDETQSVLVIDGIYNVQLGAVNPLDESYFNSDSLYLEVVAEGKTHAPRLRLTSTPFSMKAGDADTVAGLTPSEIAATSHGHDGSDITTGTVAEARIADSIARDNEIAWWNIEGIPPEIGDGDDVGITEEKDPTVLASVKDGVSWGELSGIPSEIGDGDDVGITQEKDPTVLASVKDGVSWGELSGIPSDFADGVDNVGTASSDYGRSGVSSNLYEGSTALTDKYVNQSGDDMTGRLTASVIPFGIGWQEAIKGSLLTSGAVGAGVFGFTEGSEAYGVYGAASGTKGRGVYGEATNTGNFGNYGGYFVAHGAYGQGVYGEAPGTVSTNHGGFFTAAGPTGRGVYGGASGTYGRGVYGKATNTAGDVDNVIINYGGYFTAASFAGVGVYGEASGLNGTGVQGIGRYGVVGEGKAYDFYASGTNNNYYPFTGAHEVRFGEDMPEEIRPGMIVSVTGRAEVRKKDNGEISLSSTLPTVALATKAKDKAVFGVLVLENPLPSGHWHEVQEGERFGSVNALGEGRMWVTNKNGDIETGDYITSSDIPGYGQKQDDDLLHSYTLGKAIETVDWDSVTETVESNGTAYKAYLIAVVYTSG